MLSADANGDGEINITDVFSVYINLGKTHPYKHTNEDCSSINSAALDIDIYHEIYSALPQGELKESIARKYHFELVPSQFTFSPSYPNPFNSKVSIRYGVPVEGELIFKVVKTLLL